MPSVDVPSPSHIGGSYRLTYDTPGPAGSQATNVMGMPAGMTGKSIGQLAAEQAPTQTRSQEITGVAAKPAIPTSKPNAPYGYEQLPTFHPNESMQPVPVAIPQEGKGNYYTTARGYVTYEDAPRKQPQRQAFTEVKTYPTASLTAKRVEDNKPAAPKTVFEAADEQGVFGLGLAGKGYQLGETFVTELSKIKNPILAGANRTPDLEKSKFIAGTALSAPLFATDIAAQGVRDVNRIIWAEVDQPLKPVPELGLATYAAGMLGSVGSAFGKATTGQFGEVVTLGETAVISYVAMGGSPGRLVKDLPKPVIASTEGYSGLAIRQGRFQLNLAGIKGEEFVLGTPKFKGSQGGVFAEGEARITFIPAEKLPTKMPTTPTETSIIRGNAELIAGTREARKLEGAMGAITTTENISSRFTADTFKVTTRTFSEAGNKVLTEYIKGQKEIQVFGSVSQKLQMGERMERIPGDIDLKTPNPELTAKELKARLNAVGEGVRISPERGSLLEKEVVTDAGIKQWVHAVDIHPLEAAGGYGAYSNIIGYGFGTKKPISIEGVKVMSLGEQSIRKGVSSVTPRGAEGFLPEPHRFKDIADFIGVGEAQLTSRKYGIRSLTRLPGTLFGEAKLRQYVENLSPAEKEFLGKMPKRELLYESSSPFKKEPSGYGALAARQGYREFNYGTQSYPKSYYPTKGYPASVYAPVSYPKTTYPAAKYPAQNYPTQSYPAQAYPKTTYPTAAYPTNYPKPSYTPSIKYPESYPTNPRYPTASYPAQSYPASYPTTIPPAPTQPKSPFAVVLSEGKGRAGNGLTKGFSLFVRKQGKFLSIPGVFTRETAIGLGAKIVSNTASATFKLRPAGYTEPRSQPSPFAKERFYTPKTIKRGPGEELFTQKTKYRISSMGEKQEITQKGLAALRKNKRWF